MELRSKNEELAEKWIPFDETQTYLNYILNEEVFKDVKEEHGMEMEVHNQSDLAYGKALNVISFFAKSNLGKFPKQKKWKIEVWLNDKTTKSDEKVSCGVALVRPNKTTMYTKKFGENLNEAVKSSMVVLAKLIRREGRRLTRGVEAHNLQ